jgi:hypothetical protein
MTVMRVSFAVVNGLRVIGAVRVIEPVEISDVLSGLRVIEPVEI